jgi:Asp-tRNA(Asn)/Glu-tRNA(Gln) amidotransferase A subunit family amidase
VFDPALVLDVLAGNAAEDPHIAAGIGRQPRSRYASALDARALRGKRIGLYGHGWRDQGLSVENTQRYPRAQHELESVGAQLQCELYVPIKMLTSPLHLVD